ncbi:MAG: SemiSWEET family sugar transporter [Kineosporiaceae bacterium]
MVDVVGTAAAVWGAVMALAPVLQIRAMVRRRSAENVSIGYFLVLLPGFCLWLGYGVVSGDPFLVVPNTAAVVTTVATVVVAAVLRARSSTQPVEIVDRSTIDERRTARVDGAAGLGR